MTSNTQQLLAVQLRRLALAQDRLEMTPQQHPYYTRLLTALVRERYRLARQLALLEALAALETENPDSPEEEHEHGTQTHSWASGESGEDG